MRRLAIIATHPIQYQVPWYRSLARHPGVDLKVYYAVLPDARQQGVGFGVEFQWDLPLLDGYRWELLPNTVAEPDLYRFRGSSVPMIGSVLERDQPDALIITGWHQWPMLQALTASQRLRIPRMVRGEANALRTRPAYVRLLHRGLLRQYQAFLAIGRSNRRFYLQNGVPPERIFPVPYFVDNARFRQQAEAVRSRREELRRDWGIAAGTCCFLFAGKLEPKKRVSDLLHALEIARAAGARVHLLVVGAGEQEAETRAFARERDLPVTFAGFLNQSEISRAYIAADCLVLPSDYGETWGLVVNEAMASGLPALVSDRVGCREDLVREGITGEVFGFGDVAALAQHLVALAADSRRLARMGAAATAHVSAYSIEAAVEGTLAALDHLAISRMARRRISARRTA